MRYLVKIARTLSSATLFLLPCMLVEYLIGSAVLNFSNGRYTRQILTSVVSSRNHQYSTEGLIAENFSLDKCLPVKDPSNELAPVKVFIYDLPSKFNTDTVKCVEKNAKRFDDCFHFSHCGMGPLLYQREQGTHIRDTHQFSLEVVLHYKLLNSRYRTLNPAQADLFYIPAYFAVYSLCKASKLAENKTINLVYELFDYLQTQPYFNAGKPHFSTFGKIQAHQVSRGLPYMLHPAAKHMTFITIEKEFRPEWKSYMNVPGQNVIVAPYPSYVHLVSQRRRGGKSVSNGEKKIEYARSLPTVRQRSVFVLMAAGRRFVNEFRTTLANQFQFKTPRSPKYYFDKYGERRFWRSVFYITDACTERAKLATTSWMKNAIFCLQPRGDSPSRKSYFDSILSGCIPVLFKGPYENEYPFEKKFNYSDFTYYVEESLIVDKGQQIYQILKSVPEARINELHKNVKTVAKWFQYSVPSANLNHGDEDAFQLLMEEVQSTVFGGRR